MSHFPVSSSTLSARHLGQFLQEKYLLQMPIQCRLIRCGINHTYLVQSPIAQYVFRIYSLNWRSELEIKEELRLLRLLKKSGISVSYPVADAQQQDIQYLNAPEGTRIGVLFSYAEGEKIHNYSAETHFEIGKLMAKMHLVTQNLVLDRPHYQPLEMMEDGFFEVAKWLPEEATELMYLEKLQEKISHLWKSIDTQFLRKGIAHLDIWFDNLNIAPDGKITLFDFDFCGNTYLAFDIAYYQMQLYNTEREESSCAEKLAAFFSGYESLCPISTEERALLPHLGLVLYYFYLGVQCRRHDNWSNQFLNASYLKRYITALLKRYADIHSI